MALLTQTEYAASRKERGLTGWTASAVSHAIAEGRIKPITVGKRQLIDSDQADIDWANNTQMNKPKAPRGTQQPVPIRAEETPIQAAADSQPAPSAPQDYATSRANKEYYESELARLKVEEKSGKLIPSSTVKRVLFEAGKVIRVGHEEIVAQLAPTLASEIRIPEVENLLRKALAEVDTRLANQIERLDQDLLGQGNEDE